MQLGILSISMDVNALLKRILDVLLSGIGLVILAPLFIIIMIMIKRHDGGSVFYRAIRIGRYGKTFNLYKFRSMIPDADKQGPAVTGAKDDRITPIGSFLREKKLDEIPQLLNVLKGDMSFVGPRPEAPKYVAYYTEAQRKLLNMRPGITSAGSLAFQHEEAILSDDNWEEQYIKEVLPKKLKIDLDYFANSHIGTDLILIIKTVFYTIL